MTLKEMRDAIVAARNKAGLTQEQACERLGIHKSAYTRWESGKYSLPLDTLNKIAEAFGYVFEGQFKSKEDLNSLT
ncbi:helix-turn-helix transcriptional regulator [Adhaeribacter aquaticus]|uniref:helix-turn-helix transcriptional regulator n=1 Tax=Adhaeribacter aquaticus TaxID=299567 RepID=UPI0004047BFB|nr:helix-turn-helix transcriptional regulator [Adhaeribacter aquaticus]